MKKFTIYLKEAEEVKVDTDLKDELKDMIRKSLNTSDSKTIEDFISAYKTDSERNQIEGLINDSDIYDFYLKYGEEIDEILSNSDFFEKTPDSMNVYSLYDIVIAGTKEAVKLTVNGL
jgi:vacuolar-type H+-ATPase subunit E/Vma4